jgi:hypothetical protein
MSGDRKTPPIGAVDVGEGQRRLQVKEEVERLKELGWADLRREARELGIPEAVIGGAGSRDDVRFAILEVKLGEAFGR